MILVCGVACRFIESAQDHSLFVRVVPIGRVLLLFYVDDIIITRDDVGDISSLKAHLQCQFQTKELGPLWYFLDLEIASGPRGILRSQQKYTMYIIDQAAMMVILLPILH